jgi:hypothetical protein
MKEDCCNFTRFKPLLLTTLIALMVMVGLFVGTHAAHAQDPLSDVLCPTNLGSCTANDVETMVVDAHAVDGDTCESPDDTITLDLTVNYASTAAQRYDLY